VPREVGVCTAMHRRFHGLGAIRGRRQEIQAPGPRSRAVKSRELPPWVGRLAIRTQGVDEEGVDEVGGLLVDRRAEPLVVPWLGGDARWTALVGGATSGGASAWGRRSGVLVVVGGAR